ncbi:MAG: hypothetical protein IKX40_05350 [Thermoguttaceae bacterium]|nr:hypothetical protein [Thermoguttaceae bacterium]
MSNTPFLPDANQSFSHELIALENLGKSFRNVYIFIAITFAIAIVAPCVNFICSFFTQKALAELSTVIYLMFWIGGIIYFVFAAFVLIQFFINIWNTPASIVRGGRIGKVFVGLLIACIGLFFCFDAIPIEYTGLLDFIVIILVIAEIIVYLVYMKRLASAVGSSRVNRCMNCFLCGVIICITMFLVNTMTENLTILTIEYILRVIFGLFSFFSFLLSSYYMSSDISAFIKNQRQQNVNCQPIKQP